MFFKPTILASIVALAVAQHGTFGARKNVEIMDDNDARHQYPKPYEFAFKETNTNHTIAREEVGDSSGTVRGQYSYVDRNGAARIVNYIADTDGFRASITSNEPGLTSAGSADVIHSIQ